MNWNEAAAFGLVTLVLGGAFLCATEGMGMSLSFFYKALKKNGGE